MSALIQFEHVSKEFLLRRPQARTLRYGLAAFVQRSLRGGARREVFVALRDVSFDVPPGETVGIIGENGSGKSTILKLITRIYEPSGGRVCVNGRVAGLLELGAGFHPELTGRENIYLNGSILGMSQKEITAKLDEIVAFTEIEPFIDVPVKHYSSGMYMRLGFAVAVHVQPQILLVDEVLAVGDFNFQIKCLERFYALRESGTTILFVSHDLDSVRKLCTRVLWLHDSRVRRLGATDPVVDDYVAYMISQRAPASPHAEAGNERFGSREIEITGVDFLDAHEQPCEEFRTGEQLIARIHYNAHERIAGPIFGIAVYREDGVHVAGPNTEFAGFPIGVVEGRGTLDAIFELPFLQGMYQLSAAVYDSRRLHPFDSHERHYCFRVVPGGVRDQYGLLHMPVRWRLGDGA